VADHGVMRVARPEGEALGAHDIDIVRVAIDTICAEFRAFNEDVALRTTARHHAGVVVMEIAVA
jgi:hypothetical protein